MTGGHKRAAVRGGFDRGVPAPVVEASEHRGAQAYHWGWPRSFLERVKDPIPKAIYEARLRGYDRAAAKGRPSDDGLRARTGEP